jgi:hypothetical protein
MNNRDFNLFAWRLFLPLLLFFILLVSGCENGSPKPAPIGDHAVLEQLAESYRSVAQQYPVQPASMRPAGKKKFVEEVFKKAGYSFSATLKVFAKQGVDVTSQDHRDLAELLMLAHKGLADTDMATLYSPEELDAIKAIQASLK